MRGGAARESAGVRRTTFAGVDMIASSTITREKLGWKPVGPDLITDLDTSKSRMFGPTSRSRKPSARTSQSRSHAVAPAASPVSRSAQRVSRAAM
jgi:hypothetical protein